MRVLDLVRSTSQWSQFLPNSHFLPNINMQPNYWSNLVRDFTVTPPSPNSLIVYIWRLLCAVQQLQRYFKDMPPTPHLLVTRNFRLVLNRQSDISAEKEVFLSTFLMLPQMYLLVVLVGLQKHLHFFDKWLFSTFVKYNWFFFYKQPLALSHILQ